MTERLSRQWDAGEGTPSGPLFEAGFCFAWKTADNATSTPAGMGPCAAITRGPAQSIAFRNMASLVCGV